MPLKVDGFELAKFGAARLPQYLDEFGCVMLVARTVYLLSPSTEDPEHLKYSDGVSLEALSAKKYFLLQE